MKNENDISSITKSKNILKCFSIRNEIILLGTAKGTIEVYNWLKEEFILEDKLNEFDQIISIKFLNIEKNNKSNDNLTISSDYYFFAQDRNGKITIKALKGVNSNECNIKSNSNQSIEILFYFNTKIATFTKFDCFTNKLSDSSSLSDCYLNLILPSTNEPILTKITGKCEFLVNGDNTKDNNIFQQQVNKEINKLNVNSNNNDNVINDNNDTSSLSKSCLFEDFLETENNLYSKTLISCFKCKEKEKLAVIGFECPG